MMNFQKHLKSLTALKDDHMSIDFGNESSQSEDFKMEKPVAKAPVRRTTVKKSAPKRAEPGVKRVKIILEDSENIPPTGQFVSADGKAFIIQAGKEVSVPESIISVLNDAVESYPILDAEHSVVGYRNRSRFPFRYVN